MNDSDTDEMDPEMLALLRADFLPTGIATKERVSSRLTQTVAAAAFARHAGPADPGVTPSRASLLGALRMQPIGFVASFALGAALGAALYAATRRPVPARIIYVERSATAPSAAQPSAPLDPDSGNDPTSAQPAAPASVTPPSLPSRSLERGASLAEQQALLDVARESFARSDYTATLATLRAHFQRFPKSILGEEREALEIKALAASGRGTEARTRAARFKVQFPQSLLLPSVNDSVGAIP